ncbi:LysM peptidoglycan-binding domain-containing protein [Proteiniborus sp. MB09-C3]|uniref:LysM peptidoglycan-binding domain-containing protein n=1 Tax=Proteiniborus sp. MB09-C3 TaxID=3050072 RepID=UPI0025550AFF|nr:LysM peptidoglycan-binding domain-containing protein [Proteiniborus sp. MB09-C3]WIV11374.1 LysM peptidoglycan-binding domain-containing protein [Proteiniborus sp. MB09-C3]
MSNYAIFFDYNNRTYRLPTNPEQIKTKVVQANQKYEILKLGQILIPTHVELAEYSFECELPHEPLHYVETANGFKDADYYIDLFKKLREELKPIRFIASNGIGDDINTLVLIEDLEINEKAGEEGDKYISFGLIEYRPYGKKSVVVTTPTSKGILATVKKEEPTQQVNPKSTGSYVVQSGDSLWAIAKKYYGDGNQYPKIANANKDKIKNPSLIYPGQKLVIPV